ncbi:efflux RND transporter permease subunit [Halarcobacter anaerophilus]|uniref:Multidrug transporter AcrB n=1 Tax=Halarcobacter anaerophilus TaxID=877500 RepID=A0A4Q0XVK2_9BACT|nr:efflux RND transporter permease subunit [Halarcobacter anaerophilus]QDF28016.1 RND family efflux system, inner membrane transporter, AcrB family [Halarcobacter anaerophilus]RXJ61452.1 multidrug transporter AcrB [Halarcobacter anaerophilus]
MYKLINYFLKNSNLNHTILLFIFILGVFSFIKIPKEIFPNVELEAVRISGYYSGASAQNLNNFAVAEIENQIESVSGIEKVSTYISSGYFSIKVELQTKADKSEVINDLKDAVSIAKRYLPSDMDEPTVSSINAQWSLLSISLGSSKVPRQKLQDISEKLKASLMQIKHISEITIYGDADLQVSIILNHKKIDSYNLNSTSVISAIRELSYIYPVANIEQVGNHIYLSAKNNKFEKKFWEDTILEIDDKKVYLNDIADIKIGLPSQETIARLNGKNTITLALYKDKVGDSIKLSKKVKKLVEKVQQKHKDITLTITRDNSIPINDRIKTIISNITLGLILVGFAMYILISARISLVIIFGIPFSFIIGLIFIELMGYSLNMMSMMAMLIALGIVVDDAIIVSENIQRYLDEGEKKQTAVLKGTKQMIVPVIIAGMTTVFAFLPMLLISGEMGLLMKLVPIVISCLILSSIIESFLFLPLHCKHVLKAKEKQLDWSRVYKIYEDILHKIIKYKKTFLLLFFITIPLVSYFLIQNSRFQFFPDMDSNNIILSVKLDKSIPLHKTDEVAKKYEKILFEHSKDIYIKNVDSYIGWYRDITGSSETIENGFTIFVVLQDFRDENFVESYINPVLNLSFDFERNSKTRLISTNEAMKEIRKLLLPLLKDDNVVEHNVITRRIGVVNTDIEILLNSDDTRNLIDNIEKIKEKLEKIKGVKDISDNTKLSDNEYKYALNQYGKTLGLTDTKIATAISSLFLEKEQATTFDKDGIVKVMTKSFYKDSFKELKNFYIPFGDGKVVLLDEVVDFSIERNFERIDKEDGRIYKKIFANVDNSIINAGEVLQKLQKDFEKAKDEGVDISFGGEKQKSEKMALDLIKAFLIAMFLIFITLLINFPSLKSSFIILSVIPFTILGPIVGHMIIGINLNSQSLIGMLGLAGVVINDGIVMLDFLQHTKTKEEFFEKAKQRVRPILITSITTMLGLFTLIFFPSGESVMLQPIAVSLGFGILWGTVLNLLYVPAFYATMFKIKK